MDVAPGETLPLLDPNHRLARIPEEDLPKCPKCQTGLQRPGVVWFGENLDEEMLQGVDDWIDQGKVVSVPPDLLSHLSTTNLTRT